MNVLTMMCIWSARFWFIKMKKLIIAAVCGLCLCAGAAALSGLDNTVSIAGSGGGIHVSS